MPDVLATKVGRLVTTHFADPKRLTALGAARSIRFAAARNVKVRQPVADRLLSAARDALPTADTDVAARYWLLTWPCYARSTSRLPPPSTKWPRWV